ncbi:MAG TPA: oligoribonuclease [Mycobacteriales bacterium]|jgi:oligoribonuclease|nr:oligoribonuclease [Mycobacteriales bacterium]
MKDKLVWIDLEMTGLDPDKDVILEIAVLVTDSELQPVGEGLDVVVHQPAEALEAMEDVVRDMHARSGLTDAVLASTVTLEEAQQQALALIKEHVPAERSAPLCGNSIATDRSFLVKHMPELDRHLHYRIIDVSSIKELARRWYPHAYRKAPVKGGGHRALADILESVDELRYYRSAVFVPPPAPDEAAPVAAADAAATAPGPLPTGDEAAAVPGGPPRH